MYKILMVMISLIVLTLLLSCDEPTEKDTTPPTVIITYPPNESIVSEMMNITCVASDNEEVLKVELWVDGISINLIDNSEPYSFIWNTTHYDNGSAHVITVRAYDTSNNTSDSEPITVTVDNSTTYPQAVILYPIIYRENSFTISWSQNMDDDFQSYRLLEAFSDSMVGAETILSTSNQNDTSYIVTNVSEGDVRYYQVEVNDIPGLKTFSNIEKAVAMSSFIKIYDSIDGRGIGYSVQQTIDGGYIILGSIGYPGHYRYYDILMIKTDAIGNEQWNRTFGGTYEDKGYSVQQTSDGGYILAGYTMNYGNGQADVWLIKTDTEGNEEWNKTFGGGYDEMAYSVQQTSDDGYILIGYNSTKSYTGWENVWIIKTDTEGNEEWNKSFGDGTGNKGFSIHQTTDYGYVFTGNKNSYNNFDIWLIKSDANGNEQWNQSFGGTNSEIGYSVQQTIDGGYIIGGTWLIKTNSQGNEEWRNENISGNSVQQTNDGGYIILDNTGSPQNHNTSLVKTDANGNEQWNRTFGGSDGDYGYAVQQTTDMGYIITGSTDSYGSLNVWLIKTDEQGNTN